MADREVARAKNKQYSKTDLNLNVYISNRSGVIFRPANVAKMVGATSSENVRVLFIKRHAVHV